MVLTCFDLLDNLQICLPQEKQLNYWTDHDLKEKYNKCKKFEG